MNILLATITFALFIEGFFNLEKRFIVDNLLNFY